MDALTLITSIIAEYGEHAHDRWQTRALRPERALVFVNQYVVELNDFYRRASGGYPGGAARAHTSNGSAYRPTHNILAVGRQIAAGTDRTLAFDAAPKKSAR